MIGIIIFTITGLILSTIIVLTDNYFSKNNKDKEILEKLPGYKCGFGSCEGMKEAILENKENYKKCRFIKDEKIKEYFENLK